MQRSPGGKGIHHGAIGAGDALDSFAEARGFDQSRRMSAAALWTGSLVHERDESKRVKRQARGITSF